MRLSVAILVAAFAVLLAALANGQSSSGGGSGPYGQRAMANSVSVVVASDQTTVPISGTVTSTPGTGTRATYRADFSGVVGGGAGNLVELTTSGAKIVEILAVHFAKPSVQVTLVMRQQSANSSGGSSTTVTTFHDTADAAPQAVVKQYTAAPTPGALTAVAYTNLIATTDTLLEEFGPRSDKPWVVRSGESAAINVSAATTPSGGYILWTEH